MLHCKCISTFPGLVWTPGPQHASLAALEVSFWLHRVFATHYRDWCEHLEVDNYWEHSADLPEDVADDGMTKRIGGVHQLRTNKVSQCQERW